MHGCIVLTLGLLAGVGFSYAVAMAESASQLYATWHFAHLEGLLNGVVVLAIGGTWTFIEDHRGSTDWGRRLLTSDAAGYLARCAKIVAVTSTERWAQASDTRADDATLGPRAGLAAPAARRHHRARRPRPGPDRCPRTPGIRR
jgi:hypothetical protein